MLFFFYFVRIKCFTGRKSVISRLCEVLKLNIPGYNVGEVNVDDLKIGMILHSDLLDSRGRFLLGRGSQIEEKHIRVMKIWGITAADVEGVNKESINKEALAQIDPTILKEARSWVDSIFSCSDKSHEALEELKRLCIIRISEKLAKGIEVPGFENYFENGTKFGKTVDTLPLENKISIDDLIEKNIQLSSFPDIYFQIVNVLNDSRSSAVRMADVVGKDPGLSAALLKLVNSSFYSIPTHVDSISRAITLIGGRELVTLAMGISVIRYFKDIPQELGDMKSFWLHSIACGVLARILANYKIETSEEQFFIGGLLHDIGRILIYKQFPKTITHAIRLSIQNNIPLYIVEKELLGYDHSDIAGLMLKKWNFPNSLAQMIRFHHNPFISKNPPEPSIIYVSDIIAKTLGYYFSGNPIVPPFKKEAWVSTGLSPSVLSYSIKQADRQVSEILNAFNLLKE